MAALRPSDQNIRSVATAPGTPLARSAIGVLLAFALGGCALLDDLRAAFEPQPEAGPGAEPAPAAAAPAAPATPFPPRPKPTRIVRLPVPPERPAAPTPSQPSPEIKLVGLSRDQAVDLLGRPADEREAAPAKIWEYRTGECVLDVYFYLDVARNEFYALHYDVRAASATAAACEATDRCLQRIHSENR